MPHTVIEFYEGAYGPTLHFFLNDVEDIDSLIRIFYNFIDSGVDFSLYESNLYKLNNIKDVVLTKKHIRNRSQIYYWEIDEEMAITNIDYLDALKQVSNRHQYLLAKETAVSIVASYKEY